MSQNAVSIGRSASQAGSLLKRFIAGTGPLIVLFLLAATLWFLSPPFRTPTSLMLIGLEAAALGIVAAGQTFVILTGGIDLSVEAMVSFAGVVAAILIAGTNVAGGQIAYGVPSWVAIIVALAAGALVGLGPLRFGDWSIRGFSASPPQPVLGSAPAVPPLAVVAQGQWAWGGA